MLAMAVCIVVCIVSALRICSHSSPTHPVQCFEVSCRRLSYCLLQLDQSNAQHDPNLNRDVFWNSHSMSHQLGLVPENLAPAHPRERASNNESLLHAWSHTLSRDPRLPLRPIWNACVSTAVHEFWTNENSLIGRSIRPSNVKAFMRR